jgi:outer membrane protein assembly factor BamB
VNEVIKNYYIKKYLTLFFILSLILINIIPLGLAGNKVSQNNKEPYYQPIDVNWWPMFHHNPSQTGLTESLAPNTDDILWSYQMNDFTTSSPAVSNGLVVTGSWDNKLYCFDMLTGNLLWDFLTNDDITSSPAIKNGMVYIGSQDSFLYCIDLYDGSLIWSFDTPYMIESSPTVENNQVFFGCSDGNLYCLDAVTGDYLWSYSTGNVIWTSPAVVNNKVYFGDLNGVFHCLDSSNGNQYWSYTTNSGIWSSPAVHDNKVYFGSNDFSVYCLYADSGNFIWSYDTGGEVHSSPAVGYGNVYIGASQQGLFCLNKDTGDLVWNYLMDGGIWSPPSIADNKVYFGTDPCCGGISHIICADPQTGDFIWDYTTGDQLGIKTSGAIALGMIFFSFGNGKVIAFGEVEELIADANGPYFGLTENPIQFRGSAYGGNPEYSWLWDFGDGNTSTLQNPINTYTNSGDYIVTLTIIDNNNDDSVDETSSHITINIPPNTPILNGPTEGKTGIEYSYNIPEAIDPDEDNIYVYWDWGDNTSSGWLGPYFSGEEIRENHTWDEEGNFIIKAKLKDEYGEESDWGELEVTMPRSRNIYIDIIFQIFEKLKFFLSILKANI